VKKYISETLRGSTGEFLSYYDENLRPLIEHTIDEVVNYRITFEVLYETGQIDKYIVDCVRDFIDKNYIYSEIKKEDIEGMIKLFNEVKRDFDV